MKAYDVAIVRAGSAAMIVHLPNGQILSAQIVSARAGETIAEIAMALDHQSRILNRGLRRPW